MPDRMRALVTGASEGLGKAIALELARRNIDLILVSLPDSGLPELADFIQRNRNVEVAIFEADLTDFERCHQLFKTFEGKRIDVLINNAGLGNWAWFNEKSTSFYKTQIDLNVVAPVLLTRLFLDQVSEDQKSYILNVGSLGGLFIVPQKQVYGATKAFVSYFTKCLQLELSGSKVSISLLKPGGINTKPELLVLNGSLKGISRATILEPEKVAKKAVSGMFRGEKVIIPGLLNRLLVMLNAIIPAHFQGMIIRRKLKTHLNK